MNGNMPRRRKTPDQPRPQRDQDEFAVAVGMLNSIKVLGPDLKPDEERTRAVRQREFDKVKHVLDNYELCPETGKIIRVR